MKFLHVNILPLWFWDRGISDILSGISINIVDVWGIWNYTLNLRHINIIVLTDWYASNQQHMILSLCGYFQWVTASKLLQNVDPKFCSEKKNEPLQPKQCIYSCFHVPCLDACVRYHVFAKKVHCWTTCRGVRCFQSKYCSERHWHCEKLWEKATCDTAVAHQVTSSCTNNTA